MGLFGLGLSVCALPSTASIYFLPPTQCNRGQGSEKASHSLRLGKNAAWSGGECMYLERPMHAAQKIMAGSVLAGLLGATLKGCSWYLA